MLNKILVPTDFSESSERAIKCAEELALVTKADLLLLHVREQVPTPATDEFGYLPLERYAEADANVEKLLVERAAMLTARGVNVAVHQLLGVPKLQILRVAERAHVDLIVMGTHGRRGFRRMVLGSVAEHVVRASKIPVLTVHAREEPLVLPSELSSSLSR